MQGRKSKFPVWSDRELEVVREAHKGKDRRFVSLIKLSALLDREYDDVKARCSLMGLRREHGSMVVRERDEAYMFKVREELL